MNENDKKIAYVKFTYNDNNDEYNINITDFYRNDEISMLKDGIGVDIIENNGNIQDINNKDIIEHLKKDNNVLNNDVPKNINLIQKKDVLYFLSTNIRDFIQKIYNNVITESIRYIVEKKDYYYSNKITEYQRIVLNKIYEIIEKNPQLIELKKQFERDITAVFSSILIKYPNIKNIDVRNNILSKMYNYINNKKLYLVYKNIFISAFKSYIEDTFESLRNIKNKQQFIKIYASVNSNNIFEESFINLEYEINKEIFGNRQIFGNNSSSSNIFKIRGGRNNTKKKYYNKKNKKTRKVI